MSSLYLDKNRERPLFLTRQSAVSFFSLLVSYWAARSRQFEPQGRRLGPSLELAEGANRWQKPPRRRTRPYPAMGQIRTSANASNLLREVRKRFGSCDLTQADHGSRESRHPGGDGSAAIVTVRIALFRVFCVAGTKKSWRVEGGASLNTLCTVNKKSQTS